MFENLADKEGIGDERRGRGENGISNISHLNAILLAQNFAQSIFKHFRQLIIIIFSTSNSARSKGASSIEEQYANSVYILD